MRILQLVHTLNYGDAISGEAIAIKRLLSEQGIQNEIYSVHSHEKVEKYRKDWCEFSIDIERSLAANEKIGIILHYSIASPLNELLLQTPSECQRVLIYHNLTPERWFKGYNARVLADLRCGRSELPALLERVDLVLADSTYNKEELVDMGCPNARVLPLLLDDKKWDVATNQGITNALTGHGGKNILHVGRLAPNKCIEDILKAFYFYHHKVEQKSKLWLIGSDVDTEIYSFELRQFVSELRLKEAVEFVGAVADSELKAFYQEADAYVCMSEHEGFCVPLLEAMHFGVPIIAYNACAVSETLGEGGLLLSDKSPAHLAEIIDIVISDESVRSKLVNNGRAQATVFSEQKFKELLQSEVIEYLLKPDQEEKKPIRTNA